MMSPVDTRREMDHEMLRDLRRMHELDQLAYSQHGITLDQNIERKDLHIKYAGVDLYGTLLDMVERWLKT